MDGSQILNIINYLTRPYLYILINFVQKYQKRDGV